MRKTSEENLENLSNFELVVPAKELLDAVMASADALTQQPIDEKRAKDLKLVLGFLNAYIRAHTTQIGYFRLTMISKELKSSIKRKFWKFK